MTIFSLSRHERTPETEVDVLLTTLSALYHELHPDEDKYCFINTWFKEFYENENTSGDILAAALNRENPTNDEGASEIPPLKALVLSLAYCCQAQRAFENGNINEAWTYIVDARFWCDIPLSKSKRVDRFVQAEHKAAVSAARRASRKKGADKYDYSDFIMEAYNSRLWKNKTEAINTINKLLIDHIEANNLPVREFESTNERGGIIKTKQDDFCRIIENTLPSAAEVKKDRENLKMDGNKKYFVKGHI